MAQKLSPAARRAKAARDLAYAKKAGENIDGKDFDHKTRTFKTVSKNRGNDGQGTKKEGKRKYKTTKAR